MSSTQEKPVKNTNVELWREPTNEPGMSYYMPSVHVTQAGKIGINVGGSVYVKSLTEWHELAGGSLVQSPNPSDQITQEKLEEILDGIDKTEIEYENGWWETSTGAEFGAKTKQELQALIDSAKREGAIEELKKLLDFPVAVTPNAHFGYDDMVFLDDIKDRIAQLEQSEESE